MIAILVNNSNWIIDGIRMTLDQMDKKRFIGFLNQRGPKAGIRTKAFHLAWEFFKMRDLLGVPLPVEPMSPESKKRKRDILGEQSTNADTRGSKKPSVGKSAPADYQPIYLIDD